MSTPKSETLLRRSAVEQRTGKSRAGIYAGIAEGTFPPPVRIGARAVAWRESDIVDWIESRPVVRRDGSGLESPQIQM